METILRALPSDRELTICCFILLLTYMATIGDAVRNKIIEPFPLPEWESRIAVRKLWIACEFWKWYDLDEHHSEKSKIGGRTPAEHIDQLFCDLRCSARPAAGEVKRMIPNKAGVWKFHPAGLRLYGWSVGSGQFVVVCGASEEQTKAKGTNVNNIKRNDVKSFIKTHRLQATIQLGDINAIFSQAS